MAYSFRQLEELWIAAGGARTAAPTAAAIALAESGGNPNAEDRDSNGTIDRGLWQINSTHGALSTFDVLANAKAAVKIAGEAKSWEPWVTYKTGAFEQYLTPANLKSGIQQGEKGAVDEGIAAAISGVPKDVEGGAKSALGVIESLFPGAPDWWKYAVEAIVLLAGAFLVVWGIYVAVGKQAPVPIPVPV
jgi:hypothetical protein